MSWLWLNAWVTDESRTRVPRTTEPASGVSTENDPPYEILGGAEEMLGRAASVPSVLKRYGGVKT